MVDSLQYTNSLAIGAERSCFGFRIRSTCSFRFLRGGGGEEPLEVVQVSNPLTSTEGTLLLEWMLRDPSGDVNARLYGGDRLFHFWTSDVGWYRIDAAARRIEIPGHQDEIRREQRLWSVPTMLCFMERGDFPLHAAAVEIGGAAVLLAAPGRHGKTTLGLAFHRNGYRVLTEDTSCCRLVPELLLFPGPASLRLRPDMFDGQGPPGTSLASETGGRIYLAVDGDGGGDGRPIPVSALFFLRESSEGILLERVKSSDAIPDLWTLSFHFKNDAGRSRCFSQLAGFADRVAIWNLHRPLCRTNLDEIVYRIVDTCR